MQLRPISQQGKLVRVWFGMMLASLLAFSVLAFSVVSKLVDHQGWVAHTHQVIAAIEAVLVRAVDADTGIRGYVITKRTSYLEPYLTAVEHMDRDLAKLQALTMDDSNQQRLVEKLRQTIVERMEYGQQTVDIINNQGQDAAYERYKTETPNDMMKAIRTATNQMIANEYTLLEGRQAAVDHFVMTARTAIPCCILLCFVLMVGGYQFFAERCEPKP